MSQLNKVVLNLAINAKEAMGVKGFIGKPFVVNKMHLNVGEVLAP